MKEKTGKDEENELETYIFALFLANDAAPIRGRIMLVKQIFLIVKQNAPQLAQALKFFPYQYGPYSNKLALIINDLIDKKYVTTYKDNGDYIYELTELGKEYAQKHVSTIPNSTLNLVSELKTVTQELGIKNLLKMVYREYPDYAVYSRGREVYGTS